MRKRVTEKDVFTMLGEIFSDHKKDGFTGIGADDCALVPIDSHGSCMAMTTDFIRGTEYSLYREGKLDHYDLGYYLASANLSDLASTGALPTGLLMTFRYSEMMTHDDISYTLRGFKNAIDKHGKGALLLGGDSGSYGSNVLSATAFGTVKRYNALLRGNAKKGDLLCVTGKIGGNGTALAYFNYFVKESKVLTDGEERNILRYWKEPIPRVTEGLLLSTGNAGNRVANACMDISDGLTATINEIARKSRVNFTVYGEKIPLVQEAIKVTNHFDIDVYNIAMGVSADFELVFTVPKEKEELLDAVFKNGGCPYYVIGETNDTGKNIFIGQHGKERLPGMIWNHQPFKEVIKSWKKK